MTFMFELANSGIRQRNRKVPQVRYRHDGIVLAVIEKDVRYVVQMSLKIFLEAVFCYFPILQSPIHRADQEEAGDGLYRRLFRQILQRYRCSKGMADDQQLALAMIPKRVFKFSFPWFIVRIFGVGHVGY